MKTKEAKDLHDLADSIENLAEIVNTLIDTMETELILEAVTDGFTDVPTETM